MGPGVTPVYLHTRCCLSPSPDGAVVGGPRTGPGTGAVPPLDGGGVGPAVGPAVVGPGALR